MEKQRGENDVTIQNKRKKFQSVVTFSNISSWKSRLTYLSGSNILKTYLVTALRSNV